MLEEDKDTQPEQWVALVVSVWCGGPLHDPPVCVGGSQCSEKPGQ